MTSDGFERFMTVWEAPCRDRGELDDKLGGLDAAARAAQGEDRDRIEAFLLPRLEQGDATAGRLLGLMRSEPALELLLGQARALPHWTQAMDLVLGLANYRGEPRVLEVLREAMRHADGIVRHHVADALLTVSGLRQERWEESYDRVAHKLRHPAAAVRGYGLTLLDEALRRKEAGAPPGDLDVPWAPPEEERAPQLARFLERVNDPALPRFEADLFEGLGARDREYVVSILASRLLRKAEGRCAEPLLGLPPLGPQVVEEARASSDPQVRAAAGAWRQA